MQVPTGTGLRTLLVLNALIPLSLTALLLAVARGGELDPHPWYEQPSLAAMLAAPFVVVLVGLLLVEHAPREAGPVVLAGGLASLVPAFFTLTLLLGFAVAVLAVVEAALGVRVLLRARASTLALCCALGALMLLVAAPFAHYASPGERCVRYITEADGGTRTEVFTPAHTDSGHTVLTPGTGVTAETCTSSYTTPSEAAASALLPLIAVVLVLVPWLPVRRRSPAPG